MYISRVGPDIKTSIRFVMFETGVKGWEYATHGGTLFLINFMEAIYGVTCKHVCQDFEWQQLVVTNERNGDKVAGLSAFFYPSSPEKEAIDTDITDVAIIKFSDDCDSKFFRDTAYLIDKKTFVTSKKDDQLIVSGALKSMSEIDENTIKPQFCSLELIDIGPHISDRTLRKACAIFSDEIKFDSITGISGSPVFNVSQNALCGMVIRGGLCGKECKILYIDFSDVWEVLTAVHEGRQKTHYQKTVNFAKI